MSEHEFMCDSVMESLLYLDMYLFDDRVCSNLMVDDILIKWPRGLLYDSETIITLLFFISKNKFHSILQIQMIEV